MTKKLVLPLLFACTLFCLAAQSWEKAPESWSKTEALQVLDESPWTLRQVFTRVSNNEYVNGNRRQLQGAMIGGQPAVRANSAAGSDNSSRENEVYYRYTLRLLAAPVRDAYNRLDEIEKGYDQMSPEDKASFKANRNGIAWDPDTIVVLLDLATNDRETGLELERQFRQPSLSTLRQSCYLISKQLGKVELLDYVPAKSNGLQHRFVFPRQVDGKPVVKPGDSDLAFDLRVPVTGDKIYAVWKLKKMQYQGQLAF